jgi:hypothetical protein
MSTEIIGVSSVPTMKVKAKCFNHKQGVYAFSEESIFKDGELYGTITHHDKEKKAISFTMVSDNQFMNGVKSSLNYR